MTTEIEAKWIAIDPQRLRTKLRAVGAKLVHPETLMRRDVFDEPKPFAVYSHGWVRIRDEGHQVTMSYKRLDDRTLRGTKDVTMVVDNYDRALAFCRALGLPWRSYQETKRETWTLDGAEVTIDTWPWIPTFVEIEADDENRLWSTAAKLGLEQGQALHGSVESAYQTYFEVTEEEVDTWPKITFGPTPDWLEKRRKQ